MIEMNKNIRCGPETHIIPRMIARWELGRGTKRMDDSGINSNLYDEICSEFILKIIAKHDYGSQQLCNKDPFTLRYMKALSRPTWFPKSKFVLMIRDPRAIASSLKKRKITIGSVDNQDYMSVFNSWNKNIRIMLDDCERLRKESDEGKTDADCIIVSYEEMVMRTEHEMRRVMEFLGHRFERTMLAHHTRISNITLAPNEPSTTQVTKPIYKTALYDWVKRIRSEPDKAKTKSALQRLEQMESFKRIKNLFPIYKRNFRLTDTVYLGSGSSSTSYQSSASAMNSEAAKSSFRGNK